MTYTVPKSRQAKVRRQHNVLRARYRYEMRDADRTWDVERTLRVRGGHERERREVRDADVLRAVHLMQP